MNSKIGIEGIKIFAHHGYYEVERLIGREFILDVYIDINFDLAGKTDQLSDTINYEQVLIICKEEMAIASKLLENVCSRIAHRTKALTIEECVVTVRIKKQTPYLPIQMDQFFVEVTI